MIDSSTMIAILVGVIVLLMLLLLVTTVFWMLNTQRLTNKIMSRDFAEYERVRAPRPTTAKGIPNEIPETFDHPRENIGSLADIF